MDRSFLSSNEVIAASRNFVCIRTATYEDAGEAEFIKRTIFGGSEDLRNFGFCILSADARETIRVSRRGPNFVYSDSAELASDLNRIIRQNPVRSSIASGNAAVSSIPQMKSFRLGLNVASCDGLPCVAMVAEDQEGLEQLSRKLGEVIWDEELIGKFIFASTTEPGDLEVVSGSRSTTGILVIKPNQFGTKGEVIDAIDANATVEQIKEALLEAADNFERQTKEHGSHVREGHRSGETWETEVPVPDRRGGANRGGNTRDRSNRNGKRRGKK